MLASIAEREQSRPKVKKPRLAFLQVGVLFVLKWNHFMIQLVLMLVLLLARLKSLVLCHLQPVET